MKTLPDGLKICPRILAWPKPGCSSGFRLELVNCASNIAGNASNRKMKTDTRSAIAFPLSTRLARGVCAEGDQRNRLRNEQLECQQQLRGCTSNATQSAAPHSTPKRQNCKA